MGFRNNNFGKSMNRRRDFGGMNRRREMHEVTCDKCQKLCRVPFKPSKDKPVLCSECFEKHGNRNNNNRNNSMPNKIVQNGISKEQFEQLNKKLDKIILILENLEIEEPQEEELELEDIENDDEEDVKRVIFKEDEDENELEDDDFDDSEEGEDGIKS